MIIKLPVPLVVPTRRGALASGDDWDGGRGGGPAPAPLLHERIATIVEAGPAGWIASIWPLGATEALTLETGSKVSLCSDPATGFDAVQATDDDRPTYSATGLGGTDPASVFDGVADRLVSPTIARDTAASFALIVVTSAAAGTADAIACWGEYALVGGPGFGLVLNTAGETGTIQAAVRTDARSTAQSEAFDTTAPGVWAATFDSSLTTSETATRVNGVDVTASMVFDGNPALTTLVSEPMRFGGRPAGAAPFAGPIAYGVLLRGTGTIADALTMIEAIEAELATALAAGDWWT